MQTRAPLQVSTAAALDVSAASGLCALPDRLCVVADDETFLAQYAFDGAPLGRVALFEEVLPEEHHARKRSKPDLEALAALPDGRLLALGSGSTSQRERGALIDPAHGFTVRPVDLGALYRELRAALPELNVEGAVVVDDHLVLLQRGNGRARANARIELDLARLLEAFDRSVPPPASALIAIANVALPELAGVPLSFTDAAAHAGRVLFTAAAEDTDDTYADGACTGSVIGELIGARVSWVQPVQPVCKLEGIACTGQGVMWLVADADDRATPAALFRASVPPSAI
jgi:hypothetical protein